MTHTQRSFEDYLETAEIKDFFFRAEREMFPKLQQSATQVTLFDGKVDAKLALEFGAAILFDKPILIVALKGAPIPENVRRVARAIVEVNGVEAPEDRQKINDALKSFLQDQGIGGAPRAEGKRRPVPTTPR